MQPMLGSSDHQPSVSHPPHFTNKLGPGKHDLCGSVVPVGVGGDGVLAGNSLEDNFLLPGDCVGCAAGRCGQRVCGECAVASDSFITLLNHSVDWGQDSAGPLIREFPPFLLIL